MIATWNSTKGRRELYIQRALPFGASAAVLGFNWVARALRYILVQGLKIMVSNYFDDFTLIELRALCTHTQGVVDRLMDLLGFDIKEGLGFGNLFDVLGVSLDLAPAFKGYVDVSNKESRVASIGESLARVDTLVSLRQGEAKTLRGRCSHASSATFGRCASAPIKQLARYAEAV